MGIINSIKKEIKFKKSEIIGRTRKIKEIPMTEPVDFVVSWVDSSDEQWLKEKQKYSDSKLEGSGVERYRNWDLFKYWFRAVEKYAPWVRKVHLVTCGHYPEWLNLNHKKINLVKHESFIPEIYLPTFNANPIELNIHRINGLSEHFVYFNDDMFINKPVSKEDFFNGNYPKYCCEAVPLKHYRENVFFDHMLFNNIGIINDYFDITKCITDKSELWLNKKYKKTRKYTKLAYKDNYLYGMAFPHLGVPLRKSTMEKVWSLYGKELDDTCQRKFRTPSDINDQIFQLWDMASGEFFPVGREYYGMFFENLATQTEVIPDTVMNDDEMMICLNDTDAVNDSNFESIRRTIDSAFLKKYPNKSQFEI